MIQNQARRLRATVLASDVAATCAALLAAYVVRFETVWPTPLGVQPFGNYLRLLPVLALMVGLFIVETVWVRVASGVLAALLAGGYVRSALALRR